MIFYTLKKNKKQYQNRSGYTLLFAVLTASLVLGVAAFILGIARKQYILSSTARDSMYSFYAADSGIECIALNANDVLNSTTTISINCAGQSINTSFQPVPNNPPSSLYNTVAMESTLGFSSSDQSLSDNPDKFINGSNGSQGLWGCAIISVEQRVKTGESYPYVTIVKSRGYNICTYDSNTGKFAPDPSSSRTVERALQWVTQ